MHLSLQCQQPKALPALYFTGVISAGLTVDRVAGLRTRVLVSVSLTSGLCFRFELPGTDDCGRTGVSVNATE